MKKLLLVWLMSLVTFATFAAKEDSYLLHEGFENGAIPATWTQEYNGVQANWVVEAAASAQYPAGAVGNYRAVLRNEAAQSLHYATKLVTPVMDLSRVINPIVVFSHAQAQRTGDYDTLKVYYRTNANNAWVLHRTFAEKITNWRTDTLVLIAPSSTYQLAFEAVDNMGRGVVLDEVIVRPMPTCDVPNTFNTQALSTTSVALEWLASLDADSFQVVLADQAIASLETADPAHIVKNVMVTDYAAEFTGLKQNTTYHAYVSSFCSGEQSDWGYTSVRTLNTVNVPYTQTFNMNYVSGQISHVAYWTYGTSILMEDGSMEYMPFVNQSTAESDRRNYSYTSSTCLAFTGGRSTSTAIPAGDYVYAATPMLKVNEINALQVSFWGTAFSYVGPIYQSSIIVGVMTNPEDFSTFQPIDTAVISTARESKKFNVSLANYTGEGKYVAFASNFREKSNIFYIDEVAITQRPAAFIPTVESVLPVRSDSLVITMKEAGTYNVMLAKVGETVVENGANVPNADIVAKYTNLTGKTIAIKDTLAGKDVQVYVQAVANGATSEWTFPVKVFMPHHVTTYPWSTDFEKTEPTLTRKELNNTINETSSYGWPRSLTSRNDGIFNSIWPYTSAPVYHGGQCGVLSTSSNKTESYVALPEVDTVQNVVLTFYLAMYYSSASSGYGYFGKVAVGVMENPYDLSTFVTVGEYAGPFGSYDKIQQRFDSYTGNGKFIAIRAIAPGNDPAEVSSVRLDYMSLDRITECSMPFNTKAEALYNGATFTWVGADTCRLQIAAETEKVNGVTVLKNIFCDTLWAKGVAYTDTVFAPHTTYYYRVGTICADTIIYQDVYSFTTECAPFEAIPYIEGFEGYTGGSTTKEIPFCWTMPLTAYNSGGSGGSTSYYPYIYKTSLAPSATSSQHSGQGVLNFGSISLANEFYFALPVVGDNVPVSELQMAFWLKAGSTYTDTLEVGVMTDPEDISTFTKVSDIYVKTNTYKEYIVSLASYAGNGKHIALRKPAGLKHYYYIDDIKVDYISACAKVQDVNTTNANTSGAMVSWKLDEGVSQWQVAIDSLNADTVVTEGKYTYTATTMPYVIDEPALALNTTYGIRVRNVCAESAYGEWSNMITFKTTCMPESAGDMGVITFANANDLDCWTVGVVEGTTAKPSRNTNGYLYMFNTTASDGAYAIMPMLDIDSINRLQVSFDAHGGTGAAYLCELTVGVISNPSDLSTFSAVKTVKLPRVSATTQAAGYGFNEAQRFTVRFDEYLGDYNDDFGKQIMFLSESGDLANYIYIDNISIDTIPSCLEPLEISLIEANANDLTISWDRLGGEYEVKLMKGETVVKDTIVSTNGITFDGLEMLVNYDAQVRHICGTGDTSVWSNVRSFSTACPAVYQLPYSESFENYTILTSAPYSQPNCWNAWYGGALPTTTTSYCRMYTSAKYQGAAGYYMGSTTGNATTAPKDAIAVLPAIDQLASAQISFFAKGSTTTGTRGIAVGISEYADDLDSVLASVVWIDSVTTINGTWAPYTFNLTSYTGSGKHIVIRCFGGNTSATTLSTTALYTYLDDIKVEKVPSCFRPYGLAMESATATSMTLTWTPQGNETTWDIACVAKGGELTDATITTVNAVPSVVTGLTASSEYDFYVRANCGEGDVSVWSDSISATTLCIINVEDASWNFDDPSTQYQSPLTTTATYKLENCWIVGNTSSTSYMYIPYCNKNTTSTTNNNGVPYVSSKYAYSDSCALKFGNSTATANGSYAIMPEVIANLDTMQVRFKGRAVYESYSTAAATVGQFTKYYNTYSTGTYARTVRVGVVSDPYDMSTFEEMGSYKFQEVTNANCSTKVEGDYWEEVIIPLYGATGKYVCFWAEAPTSNYFWIDDVVLEKETGCAAPSKFALDPATFTATHADLSWGSSKSQWNFRLKEGDKVIVNTVLSELTFSIDTLQPQTTYTAEVQAICSAEETSEWVSLSFTTPCAAVEKAEASWDFQTDLYQWGSSATYKIPECWTVYHAGTSTTQSYFPYSRANTTTYDYARGDETTDMSLGLYTYTTANTYGNVYAVMPPMSIDYDSTALHFWGRAAYFYSNKNSNATNKGKLYSANSGYKRRIIVGVLTDPADYKTFVPVDTCYYSHSWTSTTGVYMKDDPMGNEYWEEYTLALEKYKDIPGQITFMLEWTGNGSTAGVANYFFIDDLDVVSADFCSQVTNMNVQDVTSTSATIAWNAVGQQKVALKVAANEAMTTLLVDTILNDVTSFTLNNLAPQTTYYYSMMHFCSEEEFTEFTPAAPFTTLYAVRFYNDFSEDRTYPTGWERYAKTAADLYAPGGTMGNPVAITGTNWRKTPTSNGLAGSHMVVSVSGTATYYWLVSPTIDLVGMTDSLLLSFDLALTGADGSTPDLSSNDDDLFIVAVSEDGGTTWKKENAIIWANDGTGQEVYNDIPFAGATYYFDFSKYNGKQIKIGFYAGSTVNNGTTNLHLDNVQLNRYHATAYEANLCRYEDYADANFAIDCNELKVGDNEYEKFTAARKGNEADQLTNLTIHVHDAAYSTLTATICEGETYSMDGFNIVATATSEYKQKHVSAAGCDSIVTLTLNVLPKIYNTIEPVICQGSYYEFKGQRFYTNTTLADTLKSLVTGCDSIVSMYLTVAPALTGEETLSLCPGETLTVNGRTVTKGGVYVDTLQNALHCDSIATVTVVEREAYAVDIRAAICQGEVYNNDVFAGLSKAGVYPSKQQTVYGCDSIVTLHLLVADPTSKQLYDSISVDQLPYVINGQELLKVGTAEGVYTWNLPLCGSMVALTIKVGNPTALHSVFANTLAVAPNPVEVGEEIHVHGDFPAGADVRIVSATGALVYQATVGGSSIVLPGVGAAGAYLVVLTSNGHTYQSKLIVR